jgi:forkhead transcription factor HCM1
MAATRRAPPLQIFQDPIDDVDDFASIHRLSTAQGALLDVTSPESMSLNPSYTMPSGLSPVKTSRYSSSPPAKALADKSNLNAVVFPPPPNFGLSTDSPTKRSAPYHASMTGQPSYLSNPYQTQHYTSIYPRMDSGMDKENMLAPAALSAKNHITSAVPAKKSTLKRKMTDTAPLALMSTNGPSKKQKTEQVVLPTPEEMPIVDDDGSKPPYSYAQLIGMSILRAPNRRLTLASIYNWISTSFSFYQAGDAGWQNSIRHNLSLNKAFYKQERPKDDPGKGNYWAIVSGMEPQFMKEKPRRNTLSSESGYGYPSANELPRPMTSSSNAHFASESSFPKKIDSSKFPEEAELSSDATIPASDPAIHDGIDPPAESFMMPPPTRTFRSSPPPADIRSSPPPVPEREDTPPRPVRQQPSSRPSGGRKRKFGGLGDSGYYSSIESSATRNVRFLTSEVDRDHPARKRGRAEEEIMRMRSSSIDISPTKTAARLEAPITFSSSPFKTMDAPALRGPLTPAVVFKKPARPPMSVSPGTNLKHHREHVRQLLGSPSKTINIYGGSSPFKLPDIDLPNPTFEIFADESNDGTFPGAFDVFADEDFLRSSPLKSSKRPRLDRALTSTDALHDVFGGRLGSPFSDGNLKSDFKMKLLGSPARLSSPVKRDQPTSHPSLAPSAIPHMSLPDIAEDDDFMFAVNLPSDDSDGVDISKGFQKIGAKAPAPASNPASHLLAVPPTAGWMKSYGSPTKPPTNARAHGRPSLGRSTSTMF